MIYLTPNIRVVKWLQGLSLRATGVLAALCFSSMANAALVSNDEVLDIDYREWSVFASGQSLVNVDQGAVVKVATARNDAVFNINGGVVSRLSLFGNASATITSGQVTAIRARGNSRLILDEVLGLERLTLNGSSQIELIASAVAFDGSYLTGLWANGSNFNIRTVNYSGAVSNGLPVSIKVSSPAAVPLPAAAWMFASALIGLWGVGRRRQ